MTDATDRRRSYRLVMLILAAALVAAVVTAAVVGAAGLSMGEALRALFALFGSGADAQGDFPDWAPRLLWSLRLPRIALALIAGAALSTAGASFQGVFRNPLAEPYLLGVSAGAALGATIAIVWKPLGARHLRDPGARLRGRSARRPSSSTAWPPSPAGQEAPRCCFPAWPWAPPSRPSCPS